MNHVGRSRPEGVKAVDAQDGMRAFGLKKWEASTGNSAGQRELIEEANRILGFA